MNIETRKKYLLILLLSLFIAHITCAQSNRQKIRGVVIDKFSQTTLPGTSVQIINEAGKRGAVTNEKGVYVIPDVLP